MRSLRIWAPGHLASSYWLRISWAKRPPSRLFWHAVTHPVALKLECAPRFYAIVSTAQLLKRGSMNKYVEAEILNHSKLRHPHVIQFKAGEQYLRGSAAAPMHACMYACLHVPKLHIQNACFCSAAWTHSAGLQYAA